jgi:hypothetical protein
MMQFLLHYEISSDWAPSLQFTSSPTRPTRILLNHRRSSVSLPVRRAPAKPRKTPGLLKPDLLSYDEWTVRVTALCTEGRANSRNGRGNISGSSQVTLSAYARLLMPVQFAF